MKTNYVILFLVIVIFTLSTTILKAQSNQEGSLNQFTDPRDKKNYKTVKIGSQMWMSENLAYKTDGYCIAYYNDQSNVSKYGYQYDLASSKNVCPSGWHLPNSKEFDILLKYIGGDGKDLYSALIIGGNSGFSALFAGASGKSFWGISGGGGAEIARFISSSPVAVTGAWSLCLFGSTKSAGIDRKSTRLNSSH